MILLWTVRGSPYLLQRLPYQGELVAVSCTGLADPIVKLKLDPGRPREPMVHGFRRELRNVLAGRGETGKECDNHSTFRG